MLTSLGVPEDKFAATCVLVDKLEKVSSGSYDYYYAMISQDSVVVDVSFMEILLKGVDCIVFSYRFQLMRSVMI